MRFETATGTGLRLTPQMLFGLLVMAAGVLFTLDSAGVIRADEYIRFWPVGLVAIGGLKLWQSRRGSGAVGGAIFLGVGIWLLLDELWVFRVPLVDLWPLLLVVFGAYLVWQGLSERVPPASGREIDSSLSAMAILGAVSRTNHSKAFRSADLTAIMGGCELDLRQAAINGEAVIDVFALWGGIEIRVPENWTVDSQIVPIMGGVEEKARALAGASGHRLVLRGFAIMGGIEIKH